MANSYSDRQMLDWLIKNTVSLCHHPDWSGLQQGDVFVRGVTYRGQSQREAISSAMEASGIEPEPVETVSMAELYRLSLEEPGYAGIRAVLALAEGKRVEE